MDGGSLVWGLRYLEVLQTEEGMSLTAIRCGWFRGNTIHYGFIFVFKQNLKLRKNIYNTSLHSTQRGQRTLILHSLGLWKYKVWNCQGGLERGCLPDIQQADSKEADGIPIGPENEGKPASVCWNFNRRLQKMKPKKPTTLPDLQLGSGVSRISPRKVEKVFSVCWNSSRRLQKRNQQLCQVSARFWRRRN